jgi:hypothetical protein
MPTFRPYQHALPSQRRPIKHSFNPFTRMGIGGLNSPRFNPFMNMPMRSPSFGGFPSRRRPFFNFPQPQRRGFRPPSFGGFGSRSRSPNIFSGIGGFGGRRQFNPFMNRFGGGRGPRRGGFNPFGLGQRMPFRFPPQSSQTGGWDAFLEKIRSGLGSDFGLGGVKEDIPEIGTTPDEEIQFYLPFTPPDTPLKLGGGGLGDYTTPSKLLPSVESTAPIIPPMAPQPQLPVMPPSPVSPPIAPPVVSPKEDYPAVNTLPAFSEWYNPVTGERITSPTSALNKEGFIPVPSGGIPDAGLPVVPPVVPPAAELITPPIVPPVVPPAVLPPPIIEGDRATVGPRLPPPVEQFGGTVVPKSSPPEPIDFERELYKEPGFELRDVLRQMGGGTPRAMSDNLSPQERYAPTQNWGEPKLDEVNERLKNLSELKNMSSIFGGGF